MEEVAARYGFTPGRAGFIPCPFHSEKTASLKLYPGGGGWHCFGCGAGGSVIDFVMRLFDLPYRQAVVRICADFGLGLGTARPAPQARSALLEARRREAARKAALDREYRAKAAEHRRCWELAQACPPALGADGTVWVHPFYAEAVRKLPALEAWLDEYLGR